jgi:hypothetical protein
VGVSLFDQIFDDSGNQSIVPIYFLQVDICSIFKRGAVKGVVFLALIWDVCDTPIPEMS